MSTRHYLILPILIVSLILISGPSLIGCTKAPQTNNAAATSLKTNLDNSKETPLIETVEDEIASPILLLEGEPSRHMQKELQHLTTATRHGESNRMPSLFMKPEEQYLDKYAACLAATEGLRKLRDSAITGTHPAIRHFFLPNSKKDSQQERHRQACSEYVLNSNKVIRALGLSVAQFNQIGRLVSADPVLKEKVIEQAYLYRITATLKMDKIPLIEDPNSEDMLRVDKKRRIQMFAKSMNDIEELRQEQTEKLLKALSIDSLPESVNISDPKILPFLSPQIRAVVEAFPLQAEEIVKNYGLSSDEFNRMLQEANCNKGFRMQVDDQLKKTKEETRLNKFFNN